MHLAKDFRYRLVAALVHGKTLSVPIAGGAKFFELGNNPAPILFFPFPRTL